MKSKRNFHAEGRERGASAGTWVEIDGDNAAALIQGYDDGDPEIMDICPSPLSGEWAGESLAELDLADASDDELNEYEAGFSDGFWFSVLGSARCQVGS